MKLSLCICVCVMLVGLVMQPPVKPSPVVTRSNYRGKRGNAQPFISPPCTNETTLICRDSKHGKFEACMNPRAAQEQIRLGHATLGECPDPCADCNQTTTSLSIGDLVDVDLTEPGNRRKRAAGGIKPGDDLVSDGNGMFILESHKITICHNPEGPSPQTLVISAQALQAHLDHGDIEGVCPDCFCDVAELEDTCIENPQAGEHLIFNGTCYKNANECPTSCDDSCPSACDDTCPNACGDQSLCPTSCDDTCPSACGDQSACPASCGDQTVCPASCDNACPSACGDQSACPAACDSVCPSACGVGGPAIRFRPPTVFTGPVSVGTGIVLLTSNPCPVGSRVVTGNCAITSDSARTGSFVNVGIGSAGTRWNCLYKSILGTPTTIFARADVVCEVGPLP